MARIDMNENIVTRKFLVQNLCEQKLMRITVHNIIRSNLYIVVTVHDSHLLIVANLEHPVGPKKSPIVLNFTTTTPRLIEYLCSSGHGLLSIDFFHLCH